MNSTNSSSKLFLTLMHVFITFALYQHEIFHTKKHRNLVELLYVIPVLGRSSGGEVERAEMARNRPIRGPCGMMYLRAACTWYVGGFSFFGHLSHHVVLQELLTVSSRPNF